MMLRKHKPALDTKSVFVKTPIRVFVRVILPK
jgi:hypothetical protein